MEVSLPQITNKKHIKTACSSKVSVKNISTKTLQFIKDILLIFTRLRHWKPSNFVNL